MSTIAKDSAKGSTQNTGKDYWSEQYVMAEHWQSDLKFDEDELRFLKKLIDKYFLWLIDEKHLENTRKVANRLSHFEKDRLEIDTRVGKHMHHLVALIENSSLPNASACESEHNTLRNALADLQMELRAVKKEIFQLAEHVMDSNKARRLLESAG
ncbi:MULTISPECIES: hypothetical protein [unclassified Imperialibacter]|uniref:hypothetical protein n=1 Tax=unclassified Imperialibacter TaxID=2629706 RepID=UPI001254C8FC|nr:MULTISPECIES: hypothetical protein [unclassified Imperialibacter]CAD5265118.1 hypothetical protein IMPERIA89_300077 [Imperialibacter sp. 89]CAD5270014.1 hypothetical protein IMPERIA75_360078 [Imperialibacter sp. 75]VVT09615.1 conserved hypothetical protein [Imperialibacter sp. EC-SDR9]